MSESNNTAETRLIDWLDGIRGAHEAIGTWSHDDELMFVDIVAKLRTPPEPDTRIVAWRKPLGPQYDYSDRYQYRDESGIGAPPGWEPLCVVKHPAETSRHESLSASNGGEKSGSLSSDNPGVTEARSNEGGIVREVPGESIQSREPVVGNTNSEARASAEQFEAKRVDPSQPSSPETTASNRVLCASKLCLEFTEPGSDYCRRHSPVCLASVDNKHAPLNGECVRCGKQVSETPER